jgi:hypothetical protein
MIMSQFKFEVDDVPEQDWKVVRAMREFLGGIKQPITNADRIRAMSDEELANFFADRCLMVGYSQLTDARYNLTATQIEAQKQTAYCILMRWFKQPAEG